MTRDQPLINNDHIASGAMPFSDEVITLNEVLCECGHPESDHRSIPPYHCQHGMAEMKPLCECSTFLEEDGARLDAEYVQQRDILLDIIDELVDDISRLAADDGWKSLKSVIRAQGVSRNTAVWSAEKQSAVKEYLRMALKDLLEP